MRLKAKLVGKKKIGHHRLLTRVLCSKAVVGYYVYGKMY